MNVENLNVEKAVETLLRGYEEEASLYSVVRNLTLNQRETLHSVWDLQRFADLLDEKEDLLQIIGQIDEELAPAKTVVMAQGPERCPHRNRLTRLLDKLTEMIEEIRLIEGSNASILKQMA